MNYGTITEKDLHKLADFDAAKRQVDAALHQAGKQGALGLFRFFARYTSWNGFFGSGVASLAGKIGRSRAVFVDPQAAGALLGDRSVFVASFFFDAARDEFDDRDTVHRDTHRCLAQATLSGILRFAQKNQAADAGQVAALMREPAWLRSLNRKVAEGYGNGSSDTRESIMAAIGYHLGSEILADREFSLIDEYMRSEQKALAAYMKRTKIEIAGQAHVAYQWLQIHSGHGGAAEADHFEWATKGAKLAFAFTPPRYHAAMRKSLDRGFQTFAKHHQTFFYKVMT